MDIGRVGDQLVDHREQLAPFAETVKGPDLDQTFERPFAHLAQIDPICKIFQTGELAPLLARVQDCLHRRFTHHLHRRHPKADRAAWGDGESKGQHGIRFDRFDIGGQFLNVKIQPAIVDIRRHHANAHAPTFIDKVDDLFGLVPLNQQQRRHILDGVVGL